MKSILTIVISFLLIVSGLSQTRNVVVGTNDVIVSPTNFWNANASNGRSGLGLGSAATNPASAFQPSSSTLSNLSLGNGVNLTNISVSGVVGALSTNGNGSGLTNLTAANIVGSSFSLTSPVLSNLALSNAANLTNVRATNIVGTAFPLTSIALSNLALNNGVNLTNIQASNVIGSISATNIVGISFSNSIQNFVSDVSNATNTVTNSRNVTVYSIFPTVNTITNTVQLPTSNAIAGDLARIIHTGPTNSLTMVRKINESTNLVTINQPSESVNFVYDGTNWLVLPNSSQTFPIYFSGLDFALNAAISRTNLGLGWSALTNSNVGTSLVSVDSNGSVVSPTNFWQSASIASNLQTIVQTFSPTTNSTNAATNGRNVYVYSLATNVSGITNTVTLPTNAATINGDNITVIHQGLTNTTTEIRKLGQTNNLITINKFDEAVKFIYENGDWAFYHNISFVDQIQFSGTNAADNAAASRTNLVLGATWLTNTNVTNFRTAIGVPSSFGSTANSAIGGGIGNNFTSGQGQFIGGGGNNSSSGSYTFVGGGQNNQANGGNAVVVGGFLNVAHGIYSAILGGENNTASNRFSTIIGGNNNTAMASNTIAAGSYARATNNGAFVWSDDQGTNTFSSTNTNSFNIRAAGGMSLDLGTNGIIFRTNASAAATRTNLGLGATNEVIFSRIRIENTNVGPFEGLVNLINSNNTTLSNETLFRVGLAEETNRSAQFGFRVARTNNGGEGFATFSVYGYNALMMIGPSDRSRTNTATNAAIEADIFSISDTNKVMTLVTTNTGATLFHRPIEFNNTTNQAVTRTNIGLGGGITTNIDVKLDNNAGMRLYFNNGILTNSVTPIP